MREIIVCSTRISLFLWSARKFLISTSLPPRAFIPAASCQSVFRQKGRGMMLRIINTFAYVMTSKETNRQTYKIHYGLLHFSSKRWSSAVVAIKDYSLESQNTDTHTCLNYCTAFKQILGTQERLTMNVQSLYGVKKN